METIKSLIVKKIRPQSHGTFQQEDQNDENVRKELEQYLHVICLMLPGENDSDKNPVGVEFAQIMFDAEKGEGNDLHKKAVNELVRKIMDERDDLSSEKYIHLRQKIVEAITTTESWRDLYDGNSYEDITKTIGER